MGDNLFFVRVMVVFGWSDKFGKIPIRASGRGFG